MSQSTFLKQDENGNWGKIGVADSTSGNNLKVNADGTLTTLQGGVDQTVATKNFTFQNATSTNQNGTPAFVDGYTTLIAQITISGTITVVFEGSYDGSTYFSIIGQVYSQGGNQITTASAAGTNLYVFNIAGLKYVQMRTSGASGSPSCTVVGTASSAYHQWKPGTTNLGASDAQATSLLIQTTGSYLFGYNGTAWDRVRTVNTGQVVATLKNSSGQELNVSSYGNSDGQSAPNGLAATAGFGLLFNGSTWDRQRNNLTAQIFASAARTSTVTSGDTQNFNHKGIILSLNVTAASGTGGLQLVIQMKDGTAAVYKQLNTAPTAITATGQYVYMLYPGIGDTNSNNAQNISQVLPQNFRVQVIHGDSSSYTYSVYYQMIL